MATKQGAQGTGRHPHKDSAEPYPHTKETGHQAQQGQDAGQQGGSQQGERGHSGGRSQQAQHGQERGGQGGGDDLKRREYTDAQGEVHHHTRTYMEQHRK